MNKARMIEESVRRGTGQFSDTGAWVVRTGAHTGRLAKRRFIVRRPETEATINWGPSNQPIEQAEAARVFAALEAGPCKLGSPGVHSFRGSIAGIPLEVYSTSAWHIAFAENMFRGPGAARGAESQRPIRIFHQPETEGEPIIVIDPFERKVAVVGTAYAGEVKKAAFSLCNYLLPERGVLSMHASANCLKGGKDTSVLFGLSGTGKTTLSASADRLLVGDDEIIWGPEGISNLEGGCYAKLIDLTEAREPEIWRAVNRFGSILENVAMDPHSRQVRFEDSTATENTRGSYPLTSFERTYPQDCEAEPPKTVVFLMADAFGALPAVARLNTWQAQYHFLSGYTAKVAGTEIGVKEPQAVFSACFGEPFMPRHPSVYAQLLADAIERNQTAVWLLNTGWTDGGYGKGERFPLSVSRTLLRAIQAGELERERMTPHPVFGFMVPASCSGVDSRLLELPDGPQVEDVARKFIKNMEKYEGRIDPRIIDWGGPRLAEQIAAASA